MTQREEFEAWWEEFSSAHEDWRFADSDALRWATWQAAKQAQPERAPLSDEEIEQAVKTHGVSWTGYREDKHGFYTIPILSPYHYQFARAIEAAHGIKQGGQHD